MPRPRLAAQDNAKLPIELDQRRIDRINRLGPRSPEPGPLIVGMVTSMAKLALTKLFVQWDGLHLSDVGVGFTLRTVPRFALGFIIGMALVVLQDVVLFACGHTHIGWPAITNLCGRCY